MKSWEEVTKAITKLQTASRTDEVQTAIDTLMWVIHEEFTDLWLPYPEENENEE